MICYIFCVIIVAYFLKEAEMAYPGRWKDPKYDTTWDKIAHVISIGMLITGMIVIPIFWPFLIILVISLLFSGSGSKKNN